MLPQAAAAAKTPVSASGRSELERLQDRCRELEDDRYSALQRMNAAHQLVERSNKELEGVMRENELLKRSGEAASGQVEALQVSA